MCPLPPLQRVVGCFFSHPFYFLPFFVSQQGKGAAFSLQPAGCCGEHCTWPPLRWRVPCRVMAVAEERRRVAQGTCLGEMLLSAKLGLEAGCHVLGMGSGAAGPGSASSAGEGCQRDGRFCRNLNSCVVPCQVALNKPVKFLAPANGVKHTSRKGYTSGRCSRGSEIYNVFSVPLVMCVGAVKPKRITGSCTSGQPMLAIRKLSLQV